MVNAMAQSSGYSGHCRARDAFPQTTPGALPGAIGWKFTVHQQVAFVSGFSLFNTASYLKSVAFTFAQHREGFVLGRLRLTRLLLNAKPQVAVHKGDSKFDGEGPIFLLTYVEKPIIINGFHRGR
ncbi:MAG: hypothetical protein WCB94_17520, partial [Terriglobales bacterium]